MSGDVGPAFRITKIVCPCCEGSGEWEGLTAALGKPVPCNWCLGEKRLPVAKARSYADHVYTLAIGGYVCGDHDIADRDRMVKRAEAVFALLREVPPWLKSIGSRRVAA